VTESAKKTFVRKTVNIRYILRLLWNGLMLKTMGTISKSIQRRVHKLGDLRGIRF